MTATGKRSTTACGALRMTRLVFWLACWPYAECGLLAGVALGWHSHFHGIAQARGTGYTIEPGRSLGDMSFSGLFIDWQAQIMASTTPNSSFNTDASRRST